MKYSPQTLAKARSDFLKKNRASWTNWMGMGGKMIGTSAKTYGKSRERSFLKFLTGNNAYVPLTDEQVQDRFADYQADRSLAADSPYVNYDDLSMKEKIQRNYGDKLELAKREAGTTIYAANEQRKSLLQQSEELIKNKEKIANEAKEIAIVTTNNVVNSVSNAATNVAAGGKAAGEYLENEFNKYVIPGEVDGD